MGRGLYGYGQWSVGAVFQLSGERLSGFFFHEKAASIVARLVEAWLGVGGQMGFSAVPGDLSARC